MNVIRCLRVVRKIVFIIVRVVIVILKEQIVIKVVRRIRLGI